MAFLQINKKKITSLFFFCYIIIINIQRFDKKLLSKILTSINIHIKFLFVFNLIYLLEL